MGCEATPLLINVIEDFESDQLPKSWIKDCICHRNFRLMLFTSMDIDLSADDPDSIQKRRIKVSSRVMFNAGIEAPPGAVEIWKSISRFLWKPWERRGVARIETNAATFARR